MSSKKWLAMFTVAIALALTVCAVFNIMVDPFGVFGDPIFDWYSYNETNNPRVAKIAWLDEHKNEYDSYIIGSSSAASYNVAELNEYLDARFYNLFVYGCDMQDYLDFANYLINNCTVKNLILNIGLNEAVTPLGTGTDESLTERMHFLTTSDNKLSFLLSYAFCNPAYSFDKISSRLNDTMLPQYFDVFEAESGCYDKRLRDIEKIGDMSAYEQANGADFPVQQNPGASELPYVDNCARITGQIRDLCLQHDINLIVITSPVYIEQWNTYTESSLRALKSALAKETNYWDFSFTSLSYDKRFFYDETHFRNAVGSMILARIFNNNDVYYPDDFGFYVTDQNCSSYLNVLFSTPPQQDFLAYTTTIPILMYHTFDKDVVSDYVVTEETFESHIKALKEAGYTAVTFQELIDYVYHGANLPDKPVCITMDDGYMTNYDIAWPILQKYEMKGTVFAIGCSVGHDYYKDTEFKMNPHFSYEQAREMIASGVIDIQSHTYDMHQWSAYEEDESKARSTVEPLPGETEEDYASALLSDLEYYDNCSLREFGRKFTVLAYPSGKYVPLTEVLVHEFGIPVTLSTDSDRPNIIIRGLPQSLYALCRWNITDSTTADDLLALIAPPEVS